MTVRIVGLVNLKRTVALTANANGCKSKLMSRTCALVIPGLKPCPSKKNCYSATIATYDAYDAAKRAIPPGAKLLSQVQNVGFRIAKGITTIPVVMQGIPTSVAFVPDAGSALFGSGLTFVLPKCTTAAQAVSVFGVDADGNYITGPGAPALTLASDDPAQLAVTGPSAVPNHFTLTPPVAPAYAHGNHTIALTATATPGSQSGGSTQHATVDVTYNGDICGVFDNFPIPTASAGAGGIAVGSDGNLWFTETYGNKVGRITTDGAIAEYSIPTSHSFPGGITSGPGGNLWFTEQAPYGRIARATTSGDVTEFLVAVGASPGPLNGGIVGGPDGNVWFTEYNAVGKMTPTGTISEYYVTNGSYPDTIVVGPDNNLWFNEYNMPRQIGTLTTGGALTEFPVSYPDPNVDAPVGIVVGPDRALWFPDYTAHVSRITTSGVITSTFPVSSAGGINRAIVAGPDGAMWFVEDVLAIGRITTGGSTSDYVFPPGYGIPIGLVVGPDGALWFTQFFYPSYTGKIGRLR